MIKLEGQFKFQTQPATKQLRRENIPPKLFSCHDSRQFAYQVSSASFPGRPVFLGAPKQELKDVCNIPLTLSRKGIQP